MSFPSSSTAQFPSSFSFPFPVPEQSDQATVPLERKKGFTTSASYIRIVDWRKTTNLAVGMKLAKSSPTGEIIDSTIEATTVR
jgi:hypothetical protein